MDYNGYINDGHYAFWDGFENQSGWGLVNQYGTTIPSGTDTFKYYFNNPTLVNSGTYSGQVHNPENLIKGNQEVRILANRDPIAVNNTESTQYTYSAWVYSNGPNVSLTLKMKSSSGYITETIGVGTTTRMEWVKLEGTVNVPANIVSLDIQLKNMGQRPNTTGYTVWYNDVSIKKTGSEIVEEDNYYPFGLKHKGYNIAVNGGNDKAQKYKYLGQERQDELRLNWDTFRYRNYDYAIARFFGVDPISEEYYSITNYQFAHNNPVWKIEIEGLEGQETSGNDVINQEPSLLSSSIITRTMSINAKKPKYSTPDVPIFSATIGYSISRGKSYGNELAGAGGEATLLDLSATLAVETGGERASFNAEVGTLSGNYNFLGSSGEANFTTLQVTGSYKEKVMEENTNFEINALEGNTSFSSPEEKTLLKDIKATLDLKYMQLEVNLTELTNGMRDLGSFVGSYFQGVADDWFNNDNDKEETTKIDPL